MRYGFFAAAIFIILISGCKEDNLSANNQYRELKDIPQAGWDALMGKKIYFGHQSVGFNIIEGIKETAASAANTRLNIKETKNPRDLNAPIIAHSAVGRNKDPFSKIDDFKKTIEGGIGAEADIAFFKFCYVDITKDTDISSVFNAYRDTLESLQSKYPKVKFIHMTVPLRAAPRGPSVTIKRMLRLPLEDDEDNIKRHLFNRMLIKQFSNDNIVFDLASYESTGKNGGKNFFSKDNAAYPALAPEYTDDGGHLNEYGRRIIAEQLLIFLASLTVN